MGIGAVYRVVVAAALFGAPGAARAVTISFDTLAVGTIVSDQYAGVTFAPNAFTGAGGPMRDWATNTSMRIVSSAPGGDFGALGTPSLVSGNILHPFSDWIDEDGDPSFSISFAGAIKSFSATFVGVSTLSSTRLFLYNGATLLSTVAGTRQGQFVLSYSAPSITRVIVTPGDFADWVGVGTIVYTPAATTPAITAVPEPASWALTIGGFGVIGAVMRRRGMAVAVGYA